MRVRTDPFSETEGHMRGDAMVGVALRERSLQRCAGSVVNSMLICDRLRSVREALTRAMSGVDGMKRIECVVHCDDLLAQYALRPATLVLIGIERGEADGVETTQRFVATYPASNALVFGSADDGAALGAAITAGARGCLRWEPRSRCRWRPSAPRGSAKSDDLE